MGDGAPRAGLKAYLDNLRRPMPLRRKLWLIARNLSRRLPDHACCGHAGEPGC